MKKLTIAFLSVCALAVTTNTSEACGGRVARAVAATLTAPVRFAQNTKARIQNNVQARQTSQTTVTRFVAPVAEVTETRMVAPLVSTTKTTTSFPAPVETTTKSVTRSAPSAPLVRTFVPLPTSVTRTRSVTFGSSCPGGVCPR